MTNRQHHDHSACHLGHAPNDHSAKAIDPVCGMTVDPDTTPHHAHHDGQDYHFCSASCLRDIAFADHCGGGYVVLIGQRRQQCAAP